ncbi:MAG: zinc metallopeptidase [Ruminococcaceae bacterium]|nr:zinc metallopeptidase [Oscillospiraceae bacterium]
MPYFYFDYTYLIYVVPAIILSFAAQIAVKNAFSKYDKVYCLKSFTAHEITRRILDANGLTHIRVENVSGSLTDHYDPRAGVIRLSDTVRSSTSVAAVGVAAHEAGHAIQYKRGYVPIKLRNMFLPIANFGSRLSMPLILLGILLSMEPMVFFGIILFSAIVLFQIITLPVEFNASRRAKETLLEMGILTEQETKGASKVLSAAAMTYVAAALVSLMQLVRLVSIFSKKRN